MGMDHIHKDRQKMSTLSSLVNTFQSLGITGTTLTSAIAAVAANSPTAAVQANCVTILQNSASPTVVKDMATKMAEIPNLPIAVANLLPGLVAAQSPQEVVAAVQAIETAVHPTGSGFSLGF